MQRVLLLASVLAFGGAALAQTQTGPASQPSQTTQMTTSNQDQQSSQPPISSGGPVVAGMGNVPEPIADTAEGKLAREVRHELLLLPYYSIFDDLEYSVQGRTVTLSGYVTSIHSQTKKDAEAAVKRIEGVENVVNNIKVLPPNPDDERARQQVFRALVNAGGLSRYFWQAAPSVHIIVNNLHLTLVGYVNSEGDKNLAGITANQVSSLFSVTNNLQVVK